MSLAGEGVCGGWWRGGRHSGLAAASRGATSGRGARGYVGGVTGGPSGWQIVKNCMKSS